MHYQKKNWVTEKKLELRGLNDPDNVSFKLLVRDNTYKHQYSAQDQERINEALKDEKNFSIFSLSLHATDQEKYTEEKEAKGYPGSFMDKYVHRTSKDNNGVIKYYLRCEQCSCPNCIELKFDECICVDDVGAWLPVTTKALQTKHDQMQQENTRTLHTALRQELDPLKHAYTEYNKYSGKIQALLSGVSNKQKYKKEENRYCCCLPSDKEARGIPAKKEYRRYIQCEDPTAACFIKYHAECVINGDDVYAAKNPTTSTSSTNGNKRSLAQFQDEPWCCKYCTDYRENDMKLGEAKQEYLQKAHAFITVHPLQPFPEDCIVQEFVDELGLNNVNNMDTTTS